jgi:hypothetical protein
MPFPAMQRHALGRSDASECVQHEPLTFCETMKPLCSPLDDQGEKSTTFVWVIAAGPGIATAIAQRATSVQVIGNIEDHPVFGSPEEHAFH